MIAGLVNALLNHMLAVRYEDLPTDGKLRYHYIEMDGLETHIANLETLRYRIAMRGMRYLTPPVFDAEETDLLSQVTKNLAECRAKQLEIAAKVVDLRRQLLRETVAREDAYTKLFLG